jgi:anti-sigma factor RsiW
VNVDDVACRELLERITDLLDGRLTDDEQAAVAAHLAECPGCVAALDQFRRTIGVLGRLGEQDVRDLEPDVLDGLLEAFRHRSG